MVKVAPEAGMTDILSYLANLETSEDMGGIHGCASPSYERFKQGRTPVSRVAAAGEADTLTRVAGRCI
jgi:hypothetical protein